MSNHKDHCASLHSFRACDCGHKPEVNNASGYNRSTGGGGVGIKSPSNLTVSGHEIYCASLHGKSHCNCTWRHQTKPAVSDDGVKSPSHYQLFEGIEAIEVIARSMTQEMFKGYCLGNILKYRLRAGKKSELSTLEKDMAKATFYLELYTKYKGLCYDAK